MPQDPMVQIFKSDQYKFESVEHVKLLSDDFIDEMNDPFYNDLPIQDDNNTEIWALLKPKKNFYSTFSLRDRVETIGKSSLCSVQLSIGWPLEDEHCSIRRLVDGRLIISDNGTHLGTWVNGKRISGAAVLNENDLIMFPSIYVKTCLDGYVVIGDKKKACYSDQDWNDLLIREVSCFLIFSICDLKKQPEKVLNKTPLSTSKKLYHLCKEQTKCTICRDIMIRASTLDCGHSFCRPCASRWILKNPHCPLCRKYTYNSPLDNRILNNICAFIEIKKKRCKNRRERVESNISEMSMRQYEKRDSLLKCKQQPGLLVHISTKWELFNYVAFDRIIYASCGETRKAIFATVGIDQKFIDTCTNAELAIACDNIRIPLKHKIVGTRQKPEVAIDYSRLRNDFSEYYNSIDGIVTKR